MSEDHCDHRGQNQNAQLRIGFLADSFLPTVGGAETVLDHLASRLTLQGNDVTVIAPQVRGRDNRLDVPYRVKRYSRPSSKHFGVRQLMLPLTWHYLRQQFDLLHCNSSYPAAYLGTTLKFWTNLPIVVRPHGDDILPNQRICRHPRLAARVTAALRSADAVVAQGEFLRSALLDRGVPDNLIHVIHNGVDLQRFATGEPYPHPRPYLLGLGNLFRRKGFDLLLRAFARLRTPEIDLLIAGEGPELNNLIELAHQLRIANRVCFLRHADGQKKVDLLKSALCLVVPSRCEPFANVILEGLAAGLPVIASKIDGNPELVTHNHNGLLFPSECVDALSAQLQGLVDSPSELRRLRQGVPASVLPFDWSRISQQYLALYRSVVQNHQMARQQPRFGRAA